MIKKYTSLFFFQLLIASLVAQESPWLELFNGENLDGWVQLGGKAEYKIEDGCIVGISKTDTPNSFLSTKKYYADFILEFEVMVDPSLNSGVQIRSNSFETYYNGLVHGYQVEIDPSPRAFSGGIYDEGRRGWLYPLSRNEKGRTAFRNGTWNKFHIEAIGNTLKTWINGIQCTHLADDLTSQGFIGLQVHSIGSAEQAGKTVKWRNLRVMEKNLAQYVWPNDPQVSQLSYLINDLTPTEERLGWRLLWDGKSEKGWRGTKLARFPQKGWEIKDGVLTANPTEINDASPGDIITEETFSNFELELEFLITAGTNSGIQYFVDPEINKHAPSSIGCEFQILDDQKHPDAALATNGNRTVGSLYDLIAAENVSVPGRGKQFKGVGAWNKARIVSHNGHVEHWLNNEQVVDYDRWSQMFRALVTNSEHAEWKDFGQCAEGHIVLQGQDGTVHFRSIKIREF
ncbi:MAG: DUF1080 domain-containing protein [Bacteroidota bacterium]